jgi:hypothetical protein
MLLLLPGIKSTTAASYARRNIASAILGLNNTRPLLSTFDQQ